MKSVLLVINGPAYGSDETYNAFRLAVALARREDAEVSVFLMGDAVTCAIAARRLRTATTNWTECFKASPAKAGGSPAAEPVWTRARVGCLAPDRGGQPIDHGRACRLGRRS